MADDGLVGEGIVFGIEAGNGAVVEGEAVVAVADLFVKGGLVGEEANVDEAGVVGFKGFQGAVVEGNVEGGGGEAVG